MITSSSGIYKITNRANWKFYIGSSKNLRNRWSSHLCELRKGRHVNPILQRAWLRYGESEFVFEVIELCSEDMLLATEQRHLDDLRPHYNILPIAGRPTGRVMSAESRAKMSAAKKGRVVTPEVRARIAATLTGRKIPRDIVERCAAKLRGRKGTPLSEESRAKIRTARAKQKIHHADSTRAKIAAAHVGMRHTEDTKRRVSESRKGKGLGPCSPAKAEAIAKAKAVFSEEQVRGIRSACAGGAKHYEVAAKLGVARATVSSVVRRKTYAWVE